MATPKKGVLLLAIGDELLDGRTLNTNSSWFGEQLRLHGVRVAETRCVSDDLTDIRRALSEAKKYLFTVVTGGLGPTNDDRTLQGAAAAFRLPLCATAASLRHVRERYEARGLELTPHRLRLAQLPRSAKVIANPTGTAPGAHLRHNGSEIFFLPGPPNECRPMFEQEILPRLAKALAPAKLVRREFWRTFGRGESDVYQRVEPVISALEKHFPETIRFGVHISFPCIDLTLEQWRVPKAKAPTAAEIDEAVDAVNRALDSLCFTRARESLAEVVSRMLRERKSRLAVAESCTGGLLGKMLTDLPGSSDVFLGGVIAYANEAKQALLGVEKNALAALGAVSEPVAIAMAEGAARRFEANFALSITGVAGPGGGSEQKPVGTVFVGLSNTKSSRAMRHVILGSKGSRDQNRVIAAHLALDALRLEILSSHEQKKSVN